MAPLNVGLIGYGFSTKCFHLPFILPNPELAVYAFLQRKAAPTDPTAAKPGSHCTIDHPKAKHYQNAADFFADSNIDIVIVCSHTDTHAEFAEKALKAGKHVVVEKPFTRTSVEADQVIAVAKENDKLLTVFQNRRWDGDFQTIQHLVRNGAFGKITEFENHYDMESPTWISGWTAPEYTPGEGMMFGLGTHSIDQALELFGKPRSVTAFLRSLRGVESEIDDTFTIILQYDGEQKDLLVTIKTTVVSPMEQQLKALVRGTKGSFIKFGTDAQEAHAIAGMPATDPKFGVEDDMLHGLLSTTEEFDGSCQTHDASGKYIGRYPTIKGRYLGFYENLVDAVERRADIQVKPEQSRDGIRVIELARESQQKGCTVLWT